ncbi:MAG: hypothetical protein JXR68_02415 [Bacteroidales bacterium]|nr:hypothetical protein [Bacteroidales bacterium]
MTKNNFFIYVLIIAISSRNRVNNTIEEMVLLPVDSIELDLIDFSKNVISDMQLYEKDSLLMLFLYTKSSNIAVYNFTEKELVAQVPLQKNKQLHSFYVKNFDSIFVFYNSFFYHGYSDSLFQLIDIEGNVKEIYPLNNTFFKTETNDISIFDSYYPHVIFHKIVFLKNTLYFLVSKYNQYSLGDSLSRSSELPPVGSINIDNKNFTPINFNFVFPHENQFYPQSFNHYFITNALNGDVLFYTKYSNIIQKFDISKKTISSYLLKSEILDTIPPEEDERNCNQINYIQNKGSFNTIYFDKFLNLYFRTILLPKKTFKNDLFIVADSNFKKIGEGIIPSGYSSNMLFYNDYVILWDKAKTYATEGKIYFTKFKIQQKLFNKDSILKTISISDALDTLKCSIPSNDTATIAIRPFLDSYIIKESFCVLIVPFMYSCPSCKDYAVNFYSLNKDVFYNSNVFLLFDSQNVSGLKSYTNSFNLRLENKNILLDSLGLYSNYIVNGYFNPRVVVVCKNIVVYDKTYKPDEMENIATPIFKFVLNQMCDSL